jgi:muramoyltetrapeptide carboxypeptidase
MEASLIPRNDLAIVPPKLQVGDKVRFVSPASTPDKEKVFQAREQLEGWGLRVDFGEHVFRKVAYLAGTDDERLSDFNAALQDPTVRAIFATRGGKGSYRIADRLDFDSARNDPKFVVGFSDITILLLCLWKHCRLVGIHGALRDNGNGYIAEETVVSLRSVLMTSAPVTIHARDDEPTSALTTTGAAWGY